MASEYDYLFKVLLIGNSGVGKSSLLLRFTDNQFGGNYIATIGVDFKIKTVPVDEKMIKLQLWDTAGQERFRTITNTYYKGAHGIVVVFDITDKDSFKAVDGWMSQVEKLASENAVKLFVGNKSDMEDKRKVTTEEGRQLAAQYNVPYIEASAKDAMNVSEAFKILAKEIKGKVIPTTTRTGGPRISPKETKKLSSAKKGKQLKSGCC